VMVAAQIVAAVSVLASNNNVPVRIPHCVARA
jgi:hypothetical protein